MRKSVVMPPLRNLLPPPKPEHALKQKPQRQPKPEHVKPLKPLLPQKPLPRQAQKRKQDVKRWIDG
jgi:hypothetical protein